MKKLKDKKIMIYVSKFIEDDYGQQIPVTAPLTSKPMWAYFRQVGGKEYYAAATANIEGEEIVFEINWRNDFTNTATLVYNKKVYDITRIDTYEGYKQDLKLYCKLSLTRNYRNNLHQHIKIQYIQKGAMTYENQNYTPQG